MKKFVLFLAAILVFTACEKTERDAAPQIADENNGEWNLVLVNIDNPLPEDFTVELDEVQNGHHLDVRVSKAMTKMLDDAKDAGLNPIICSSYRTWETQAELYENKIKRCMLSGDSREEAEEEAKGWVAPPGTSEHQTGLAADIVSFDYQMLDEEQENTPEQKWLMENSYKYGFILRYPNDKSEITKINYEPWHYRYVGIEAAKEIFENSLCLEEYLAIEKGE